ncbi:GapA-binding peptide SR1P [Radiobacillus kanasensis]|nr:GapA-binding peptide SR1P [Radiobacillus kanasensis]UFU01351.1 GapA-binding peptide SR1P [Radiobacillus kanasensis]
MGVIVCSHCGCEIETFQTNKVTIFYSNCENNVCCHSIERDEAVEFG